MLGLACRDGASGVEFTVRGISIADLRSQYFSTAREYDCLFNESSEVLPVVCGHMPPFRLLWCSKEAMGCMRGSQRLDLSVLQPHVGSYKAFG